MSIMNMFRGAQQQTPPATATPPNPDNSRQLENPAASGNNGNDGNNPNDQQHQNKPKQNATPLDEFKDLWHDEAVDPANPPKGKPKSFLGIDPAKIKENAGKMDFSKSVDPMLVDKALGGDRASFMTVLQQVTSAAFTASLQASHSLVERGLTTAESRTFERLPSEMKRHNLSDISLSEDPVMNHEAVKPMLDMIKQRMAEKYPDATTSEITGMSKRYLKGFMEQNNPNANTQQRKPQPGTAQERLQNLQSAGSDFNWDAYAEGESGKPVTEDKPVSLF